MSDTPNFIGVEPGSLACPKCFAAMEKVQFEVFEIERCTRCKGLFVDAVTHERLLTTRGSEAIDTGAKHEENRGERVRIKCPACHAQMIRMVDHQQPHIWYESCPVCFGVYLDAGEFREQKERKVVNVIRDMFHSFERT
jgi:Zn-finger nucleic acid-binding protein